jgi:hypothetical protein
MLVVRTLAQQKMEMAQIKIKIIFFLIANECIIINIRKTFNYN